MALLAEFTIISWLVASSLVLALQEPILLSQPFQITPHYQGRNSFGDGVGVIPGLKQCGGSGRMLRGNFEKCTTGAPGPCIIPSGRTGKSELVFIPSGDSRGVEIRTTVSYRGEVKQYQNSLPDVNLVAGKEFVLKTAGGSTEEMKGKLFTSQVEIFRESDKQLELCAQADFYAM